MIKTVKCSRVRVRRASREPGIKWNSLSFVTYLPLPGNSLITPSLSRKTSFICLFLFFHLQILEITHQLIKRIEISNEKAVHPVLVSFFSNIPSWKAVDHAPERLAKRHFSVGDDPFPGIERRLAIDARQKMFNIRISFMNDIFGQVPFGLSRLQKRPRMNADFLILEMFLAEKPYLAGRIPARVPDPRFTDISLDGDGKTTVRRAGQGGGNFTF